MPRPRTRPPRSAPPIPLPAAVDLGEWTIEEAPGDGRHSSAALDTVEGRGGTLRVPLGGGARERYVRAHELGHIAWTPRRRPPAHLPEMTIQHAEDARIGRRLAALGIRAEVRLLGDAEIAELAAGFADGGLSRRDAASSLLAMLGTPDGDELARAVAKVDASLPELVEHVWEATFGREHKPAFARSVEAAEMLMRLSESAGWIRRGSDRLRGPVGISARTPGDGARATALASDTAKGDAPWGDLEIVSPPRPLRLAPQLAGHGWRAADEGTRLGDPARFFRDGRGWRTRGHRRHAGGTVLIDCSGSMALTAQTLEELLAANPVAVIATYSGNEDQLGGRLHVVARDGRRVRPEHVRPPGMCNVCDGPALVWLGRQPAPRIWVSDGAVTGRQERSSDALTADAAAIARRHAIRRVGTVDALVGEWRDAGRPTR